MTEHDALTTYNTARIAYDTAPNFVTAAANIAAAVALCTINNDWQSLLDEADNIMLELCYQVLARQIDPEPN